MIRNQATRRRARFSGRRYALLRGMWIVFEDAAAAAVLRLLFALGAGVATGPLLVLGIERFIGTALDVVAGQLPFAALSAPVIVLLAIFSVETLETVVRRLADTAIEANLRRGLRSDLTEKRARLEYQYVENPETWDLLHRVASEPETGPVKKAFDDGIELITIAVRIIGVAVVLARLGWWIVPVVVMLTVPMILLGIRGGRLVYDLQRRLSALLRRADYLSEEVLQGRDAAGERTMFGYSNYVNERWRAAFAKVRRSRLGLSVRLWLRYRGGSVFMVAGIVIAMLMLLQPLRAGLIDVAFYTAAVVAILQAETIATVQLVEITSRFAQHREFFVDLTSFSSLAETRSSLTRRPPEERFESIEFDGVSFAYPGTEERVLVDISFSLTAGHHYALVGANGSGKSTITKLMLGLYRPTDGHILINGKSIEEWPQDALNGLFGVVFQDFARYSLTVRDNVAFGNLGHVDDAVVEGSLERAGLGELVQKLPQGCDTPLGKVLAGGVDVSGGEWQRIALARSLAGAAPVRILDEPTAALDPLAESRLYQSYADVAGGLTTLFISHRLGSTKIAEEILVIDNGAIVESGTHEDLMQRDRLYAQMFNTQKHWYET